MWPFFLSLSIKYSELNLLGTHSVIRFNSFLTPKTSILAPKVKSGPKKRKKLIHLDKISTQHQQTCKSMIVRFFVLFLLMARSRAKSEDGKRPQDLRDGGCVVATCVLESSWQAVKCVSLSAETQTMADSPWHSPIANSTREHHSAKSDQRFRCHT